ncbi:hypothetical protein D3C86_2268480 [compost metagenome]
MHRFVTAFLAALCFEVLLITEIHQRPQALIYSENDISAITSVTTGRTTFRYVLLTSESN